MLSTVLFFHSHVLFFHSHKHKFNCKIIFKNVQKQLKTLTDPT